MAMSLEKALLIVKLAYHKNDKDKHITNQRKMNNF
jgi:hypothetical protein